MTVMQQEYLRNTRILLYRELAFPELTTTPIPHSEDTGSQYDAPHTD